MALNHNVNINILNNHPSRTGSKRRRLTYLALAVILSAEKAELTRLGYGLYEIAYENALRNKSRVAEAEANLKTSVIALECASHALFTAVDKYKVASTAAKPAESILADALITRALLSFVIR